ncbi:hypothetical protein GUJ93_ZPchr0001g29431 [Zizania palustris]|uniref:Uncharacterized protein n=1 Tax=Zizania palustris TaxID=103762 RepID=A0A8J5VAP2_ZIZPA|nr:hypothetical protein GUJ93_ZPchr0001g29431 [Zizania palustris]
MEPHNRHINMNLTMKDEIGDKMCTKIAAGTLKDLAYITRNNGEQDNEALECEAHNEITRIYASSIESYDIAIANYLYLLFIVVIIINLDLETISLIECVDSKKWH